GLRAEDVLLVVEISDSSLRRDITSKLRQYAGAGIPEHWVVDVNDRRVLVHRDPAGDIYRQVRIATPGETISPMLVAGVQVPTAELFPADNKAAGDHPV